MRGSRAAGSGPTWVVVLVKDFDTAKSRLGPALEPAERRRLARRNAALALRAAAAGDRVLAVCGSAESADLARAAGAEVLLEAEPAGQNPAARRGLEHAQEAGAAAALLLSSDLPLVIRDVLAALLRFGGDLGEPAVVAAPATGRGGTNALYLRPPDAIGLHFGDDSLALFAADAAERGVRLELFESPDLALDLDEPGDLALLSAR
ncbi:MAG: 2-phospho-L-lactate guanylyltransferase [Candidatus Dormibacteraeota bacterium]|nr:2-phospho-L-lactate guanylyltransferase [Candidatus Dormibacteraeota bacterium]